MMIVSRGVYVQIGGVTIPERGFYRGVSINYHQAGEGFVAVGAGGS